MLRAVHSHAESAKQGVYAVTVFTPSCLVYKLWLFSWLKKTLKNVEVKFSFRIFPGLYLPYYFALEKPRPLWLHHSLCKHKQQFFTLWVRVKTWTERSLAAKQTLNLFFIFSFILAQSSHPFMCECGYNIIITGPAEGRPYILRFQQDSCIYT